MPIYSIIWQVEILLRSIYMFSQQNSNELCEKTQATAEMAIYSSEFIALLTIVDHTIDIKSYLWCIGDSTGECIFLGLQ